MYRALPSGISVLSPNNKGNAIRNDRAEYTFRQTTALPRNIKLSRVLLVLTLLFPYIAVRCGSVVGEAPASSPLTAVCTPGTHTLRTNGVTNGLFYD